MIDWSQSPDAESIPGKVSGAWCVKGTRVSVQAIIDNFEADETPLAIARQIYRLPSRPYGEWCIFG